MRETVSVVVPVYGNAATLPELLRRIRASLDLSHPESRILFVNDASPDGSAAILEGIAAHDPAVHVHTLASNVGQNAAILTGLHFVESGTTVVLDADLQDRPEAIPELLHRLKPGTDVVFAGRRGAYQSSTRMGASYLWKGFLHLASGRRLPADAGLFFAMNETALHFLRTNAGPQDYLLSILARSQLSMVSVPVSRPRRPAGSSTYTGRMRWELAKRGLRSLIGLRPAKGSSRRAD